MRAIDRLATRNMPLSAFKPLFGRLVAPHPADLAGSYRASFVGPGWLRAVAPYGLWLGGLGGWWGKRFGADGSGTNLVQRGGQVMPKLPIFLVQQASAIDGLPVTAVLYPPYSPFPWRAVVDELRVLDPAHLLGMTYVKGLHAMPLPFLLERHTAGKKPRS